MDSTHRFDIDEQARFKGLVLYYHQSVDGIRRGFLVCSSCARGFEGFRNSVSTIAQALAVLVSNPTRITTDVIHIHEEDNNAD